MVSAAFESLFASALSKLCSFGSPFTCVILIPDCGKSNPKKNSNSLEKKLKLPGYLYLLSVLTQKLHHKKSQTNEKAFDRFSYRRFCCM